MPLQIADEAILEQFNADVLTVWTPQGIFNDPPHLAGSPDDLPRAFVHLADVQFEGMEGAASARETRARYRYELTLQRAWPENSETSLHALKVTDANAMLAVLTGNLRYAGWKQSIAGVAFDEPDLQSGEAMMQVTISVDLHVLHKAFS